MNEILEPYFGNKNTAVKYLLGVLCGLFVIGFTFKGSIEVLALVLFNASRLKLWTIITAGFFDTTLLRFVINAGVVFLCGPILVNRWGGVKFLTFVLIVNVSVMILFLLFLMLQFGASQSESILLDHFSGFLGASSGIAVALKQAHPEKSLITISGVELIKLKEIPFLLVVGAICLWFFFGLSDYLFVIFGSLSAWAYLRFFKVEILGNLETIGDRREEFSFSSFFPTLFQPPLAILAAVTLRCFNSIGLFLRDASKTQALPASYSGIQDDWGVNQDPKRALAVSLAVKAIDAKLAALNLSPSARSQTASKCTINSELVISVDQ